MNFRNRLPILSVALSIFAFSIQGSAQNITGTIVGTVKDISGATLPNATLTLTNVETNAQVEVKADENGDFVAPSLAPGLYSVKTQATGFKQTCDGARPTACQPLGPTRDCARTRSDHAAGRSSGDLPGDQFRKRHHR